MPNWGFPALTVVLLGFSLGMRHATDPDHVVAVATIVSRERSLRGAALLGSLWGVGHTLTIVLVGSAIILFGVVIPPRVGLGMELSVALMLVLLGGFNLAAVARGAQVMAAHHEHEHEHEHEHGGGLFQRLDRRLGLISGLLSVAFGAFLVYHIGFVDGLFTAAPRWTPQ